MSDRIDNPAFDYDRSGQDYSTHRKTDPHIAAIVHKALGHAQTVLNVGAGAGSYEPEDRQLIAIEPSSEMRMQRKSLGKVPAVDGSAENLPFADDTFDASMALVTVHHWKDIATGLKELRRVTKWNVVVMTFDPDELDKFWNVEYFPEVIDIEKKRYPKIAEIEDALGGNCDIISIPIPLMCEDGFQEAFYGRPEAFLKKEVRQAQSAWGFLPDGKEEEIVQRLANDLDSGEWDKKYGNHREMPFFSGSLKLIIAGS